MTVAMAQQNKNSNTNQAAVWRCDFCHKAEFDTLEAADEHETSCSARPSNANKEDELAMKLRSTEKEGTKGSSSAISENVTPPVLLDANNEGAPVMKLCSTESGDNKGVSGTKQIAIRLDELPEDAKSRFGEGGFERYRNGNTWFPILEISPNDVEDNLIRSKWCKMFEKVR
jgi:hypothetical protein